MKPARTDAFLKIASEELDAAERLEKFLPRQSAYFLSQSVEKLLRALVEHGGQVAGVTHNLGYLISLLPTDHPLRADFVAVEHLTGASTSSRYPSPTGRLFDVDSKRLSNDMNLVRMLIGRVTAYLAASR